MLERTYTNTDKDGNVWSKSWGGYGLNGGPVPKNVSVEDIKESRGLNTWEQFAFIKVERQNNVRKFIAKYGVDLDKQVQTQTLLNTLDRIQINCDQTAIKYLMKTDQNEKLLFSDNALFTILCYACKNDSWDRGSKVTGEQLYKFISHDINEDRLSQILQVIVKIKQINIILRQKLSNQFIKGQISLILSSEHEV